MDTEWSTKSSLGSGLAGGYCDVGGRAGLTHGISLCGSVPPRYDAGSTSIGDHVSWDLFGGGEENVCDAADGAWACGER